MTTEPTTTSDQPPDADPWTPFHYADDDRLLGPGDLDTWTMTAAGYLDQRADNRYGDYGWQVRNRTYTWWPNKRRWTARAEYRAKPHQAAEGGGADTVAVAPPAVEAFTHVQYVLDLSRLSVDLDTAAGTVHALRPDDAGELRRLATELALLAAALEGNASYVRIEPYPWS